MEHLEIVSVGGTLRRDSTSLAALRRTPTVTEEAACEKQNLGATA